MVKYMPVADCKTSALLSEMPIASLLKLGKQIKQYNHWNNTTVNHWKWKYNAIYHPSFFWSHGVLYNTLSAASKFESWGCLTLKTDLNKFHTLLGTKLCTNHNKWIELLSRTTNSCHYIKPGWENILLFHNIFFYFKKHFFDSPP